MGRLNSELNRVAVLAAGAGHPPSTGVGLAAKPHNLRWLRALRF
jgi:hypothetical protein